MYVCFLRRNVSAIVLTAFALAFPFRALADCGDLIVDPGEQCDLGFFANTCCQPDCTYRSEGTPCDDRDECTTGDTCDASGTCVPVVAVCDDGDPCTMDWCGMAGCTSWPQPKSDCTTGERSTLVVRDVEHDPGRGLIRWRLSEGAELVQADVGDPVGTTPYRLCLFRETTDVEKRLAAELTFGPGDAWTVDEPKGATYEDKEGKADGVTKAQLRTGAPGRSRLSVTAKGANLEPITHYDLERIFEPDTGLMVQLHNMDSGRCWNATFPTLRKNNETVARATLP